MVYLSDITEYLASLFPECENFYTLVRDDKKEKSLTVYKINGIGNQNQLGGNIHKVMAVQVQIIYGKSVRESEAETRNIAEYIAEHKNEVHSLDGKEFYLIPKNNDEDFFYFGTNTGGFHKYGLDLLVYYN